MNRISLFGACVIGLMSSVSGVAIAQTTPATDAAKQAPDSTGIEDIVVTAQRRSENLQDVPIAVQAVTAETISARRLSTTEDLKFLVPSLSYNAQAGFAVPYLRGIGTDVTQPNSDPSVATYVDGVYIANVAGTITSLLGVERVEVLLGPQGTLYGKNAVGGAINVVTRTPGDELEGEASVGYGNNGAMEASAFVSGPLADNLAAGIYALGRRSDGFYNFTVPHDERTFDGTPDHESSWGVRGKLAFDNGPLRIVGSLEYSRGKSADAGVLTNIQPRSLGELFGSPFTDKRFSAPNDGATFNNPEAWMGILRGELDVDFATLISLSSYRDLKVGIGADFDGTLAPLVNLIADPTTSKTFSQELQLQSKQGSPITWVVGAYYFHENGGFLPTMPISSVLFAPVLGPGSFGNVNYGVVKTDSYAVYGQATVPVTDSVNLTVGGRYSRDEKRLTRSTSGFRPIADGDFSGPEFGTTVFPQQKAKWTKFTPKVTLDFKTGDTMFYATFSKGYKPGTFNIASPATPGPVRPETLTAYEAGVKSDLAGGRVRLNAAAYYYDFTDIQVQVNSQDTGSLAQLRNGAKAEAYGFEIAAQARPTQGLNIYASASVESTEYKSFPGFPGYTIGTDPSGPFGGYGNTPTTFDASGNDLVRAPKFVSTAGFSYELPVTDAYSLTLAGDWYHNDGFYWEASNQIKEPAYDLFNASVALDSDPGNWTLMAWMKNITNERYFDALLISDFGTVVNDANPRTYGITFTKRF